MDRVDRRIHGDLDPAELLELGVDASRLLDLGVNISPFGTHPDLIEAIRNAPLGPYPDRESRAARSALALRLGCEPAQVILGNGAAELIWVAVRVFSSEARPLLVVGPTFGEPLAAARANGVPAIRVDAAEADGFAFDVSAIERAIRDVSPGLVYLCMPNNPTGTRLSLAELDILVRSHERVRFLIDQAFLSLSDDADELGHRFGPNAIVVRSMTKEHALAGVRVAYALASESDVRSLEASRPPWTVSAAAQAAVVEAVRHEPFVVGVRARLLEARDDLVPRLRALGLEVVPSRTFFSMVRTGDADALRGRLLRHHAIAVRSCSSFGFPDHVRIAARDASAHERLVDALTEELGTNR